MSNFSQIADRYDTHAHVQQDIVGWASPFIKSARDNRILEMGTGTGLLTKRLLGLGPHSILATDRSPQMLSQCARKFAGDPRFSHQVMDAWEPEFDDFDGFDAVYSSNLLQWAEDPAVVISNWKRCLNPEGGYIHAIFFVDRTLHELRSLLPQDRLPVKWRTRKYWDQLFEEAGLKIRFSRDEERTHWSADAVELFRMFKDTGVNVRNQFNAGALRRVIRDYQKQFSSNSGVRSTWHYYQIEAYF